MRGPRSVIESVEQLLDCMHKADDDRTKVAATLFHYGPTTPVPFEVWTPGGVEEEIVNTAEP
ncbi:hypothetical protein D4R49_01180 [bacterium]|nr:MAG: hypothetical protein D4R49_01180 [bacterium]